MNQLTHLLFNYREDWSYVYYLGKLSEKLKYSREKSFAYCDKVIALNPSAVDPFYRMHASRLKLLWSCPHNDKDALKVIFTSSYFSVLLHEITHTHTHTSFLVLCIQMTLRNESKMLQ